MSVNYNFLTSKQKKVYSAIESYIKSKGIPPTIREIGEIIGEKTPGAVQGILKRLEQKGAIKRGVGMARSIQLVSDTSNYAESVFVPEIKKISTRNINDLLNIYNINKYHPISLELFPKKIDFLIRNPENNFEMLLIARGKMDGLLICEERSYLFLKKEVLTKREGAQIVGKKDVIVVGQTVGLFRLDDCINFDSCHCNDEIRKET